MKIIVSSNSSWNVYNFRFNLIKKLIEDNHKIFVLAPLDKYTEKLVSAGCVHYDLSLKSKSLSPLDDALLLLQYVKILTKVKPEIFLGFTIKPNIYGSFAANLTGTDVVNNISGLGTAFLKGGILQFFVENLYKIALKRSFKVFFQNGQDLELFRLRKIVNKNQSTLIPGSGIDTEKFSYTPLREKKYNLKFLYIGRIIWDKGIGEFTQAAKIVKTEYPEVIFQLLGFIDNYSRSHISKNQVDRWVNAGLVDYLGETDDVTGFIKNADCIVLPSYREGIPRSLLEAASMGRPIIATDVPGCRDVVDHKINGFLCKSADYKSLADSIKDFLSLNHDKRVLMGLMGRDKIKKEFKEEFVISSYHDAIKLLEVKNEN